MIRIQDIQFQRRSKRITLAKRGGILVGFWMASACSWEKRRTSQKLSSKKIMVNTNVMV
ncbi:hypothetical protein [Limosilactobacillus reuteri]|uniref:hypothetical protein n=1 Tax=Limosilactobacillus reuteri TaxID=1598 RepID=UPI0017818C16|nr:hypothetical protein [Limosilactobacillus reuteri]